MPELRLVVLALQDKLAYGPTFESALASLFGGENSSLNSNESTTATPQPGTQASVSKTAPQAATDINGLIDQAGKDMTEYQRLTAEGKLGEAGQKLDQLKHDIDQLNAQKK